MKKTTKYIVGVLGRLRPSRLREYVELGREEQGFFWYEHLVDGGEPDVPFEEAEREFYRWWASTHTRRDRVVSFLRYVLQTSSPRRGRPSPAGDAQGPTLSGPEAQVLSHR